MGDADEDALDEAMDWLLARQERIERRLAQRHLHEGAPVFTDVSGSDYEGRTCPLMRFGDHRDGQRAKPQVVYTVLSAPGGCPVAVQASPGNTADPNTVADQVVKLREHFGLQRVVLVGDRGLLTQVQIDHLKRHPGVGWVSALRAVQVRSLVEAEALQLSLFDEQHLGVCAAENDATIGGQSLKERVRCRRHFAPMSRSRCCCWRRMCAIGSRKGTLRTT